jgi:hypothetical protein
MENKENCHQPHTENTESEEERNKPRYSQVVVEQILKKKNESLLNPPEGVEALAEEVAEIEEHEMTPFEAKLAQAILGALEYRGFYDCGKYLDTSLIERIRPLLTQQGDTRYQQGREDERERIEKYAGKVFGIEVVISEDLKNKDYIAGFEAGKLFMKEQITKLTTNNNT